MQCLFLNVDTDADTIANIEMILLLLLIYFQLANNLDKTSKYLSMSAIGKWTFIKANFLNMSK